MSYLNSGRWCLWTKIKIKTYAPKNKPQSGLHFLLSLLVGYLIVPKIIFGLLLFKSHFLLRNKSMALVNAYTEHVA